MPKVKGPHPYRSNGASRDPCCEDCNEESDHKNHQPVGIRGEQPDPVTLAGTIKASLDAQKPRRRAPAPVTRAKLAAAGYAPADKARECLEGLGKAVYDRCRLDRSRPQWCKVTVTLSFVDEPPE